MMQNYRQIFRIFALVLLVTVVINVVEGGSVNKNDTTLAALSRLRRKLFSGSGYNRRHRPVEDPRNPTVITILFQFENIDSLDIEKRKLSSSAYVSLEWPDEFLKWDPRDYSGIEETVVEKYEVWTPTIRVTETNRGFWDIGFLNGQVTLNSKGIVSYSTGVSLSSSCPVDLRHFPHDTQVCTLKFKCNGYDSTQVKFIPSTETSGSRNLGFGLNPEWNVTVNEAKFDNRLTLKKHFDTFEVKVTLSRKNNIYTYFLNIPYFVALLLGFVSFLQPVNGLLRVIFSCASLAVLFCLLLVLCTQLGYHSVSVPLVVKDCSVYFCFIAVGSLLFPFILNFIMLNFVRSNIPPPRLICYMIKMTWIKRIFVLPEATEESKDTKCIIESSSQYSSSIKMTGSWECLGESLGEWRQVLQLIDRIILFLFVSMLLFL